MSNELLRKEKISARKELSIEQLQQLSKQICRRLSALPEYQSARNIMLYRAVPGEVQLDYLTGDNFIYPLCIDDGEMIALRPNDAQAWQKGYCGIFEPVPELSTEIAPKDLDLVVCPCTAFDSSLNRLGMGKGFYDRFLAKCTKALFIAVAFEIQKADSISHQPWDIPMDMIITENKIYR